MVAQVNRPVYRASAAPLGGTVGEINGVADGLTVVNDIVAETPRLVGCPLRCCLPHRCDCESKT
jgi:hypothetical protein